MNSRSALIPVSLDGADDSIVAAAPAITVTVSQAAVDHLAAWTRDQRTIAVHEAGHTVVAALLGLSLAAVSIKSHSGGRLELGIDADDQPRFRPDSMLRNLITASLAGLAAEQRILGEGSETSQSDIAQATQIAQTRLNAGLVAEYPPIDVGSFQYGGVPQAFVERQADLVIVQTERARAEAQQLVADHADQILAFAARLFAARRLDGDVLVAALREVGVDLEMPR
ncbi:MAG: hypothetical protein WEG56_09335 [Chloroflexota bacterium]